MRVQERRKMRRMQFLYEQNLTFEQPHKYLDAKTQAFNLWSRVLSEYSKNVLESLCSFQIAMDHLPQYCVS